MGPLLAGTLGVALWGSWSKAQALGAPGIQEVPHEIVVTAAKYADAALAAKVTKALLKDAYINADHISVWTQNGVIHVQGYVSDLEDLFDILGLAHRIAGKRGRVVNEIELMPIDDDGD